MKKFLSFGKKALFFTIRTVAVGMLPAIATYYWTSINHYNYWNRTIFAVQTIDFKILSHTLPTKLSALIIQNDTEEIQRTLQSNTGRFGIILTDCKNADKNCPSQTVLYKTQSNSSWSENFSIEVLKDAPFDILRDPPPLKTEIDFPELRIKDYKPTGQTNTGQIIGRVYYIRGIPPSYIESWISWVKDTSRGVGPIYTSSVVIFLSSWVLLILAVEITRNKIKAKSQQNEQLGQKLEEARQRIRITLQDKSKLIAAQQKAEEEEQDLLSYLQQSVCDAEKLQASLEDTKSENTQLQFDFHQKLDESAQYLVSYEQSLQTNSEYIADLKKTIEFQKENFVPQSDIAEFQQKLDEAEANKNKLLGLINHQNHDILLRQQDLEYLAEAKEDLEFNLANVASKLDISRQKAEGLESKISDLEALISKNQSEKKEIEITAQKLEQKLGTYLFEKQKLSEQIHSLEEANIKIAQSQSKDKEFYEDYAKGLDQDKTNLEKRIKELEQINQKFESELNLLKYESKSLSNEVEYLSSKIIDEEETLVNISSLYIGFVGGHSKTLNRVITKLKNDYGLTKYVLIESGCDHNQSIFRAKLKNCNLIVYIIDFVGHDYFNILKNLQATGAVTKEMLKLNGAQSGIVREVINYFKRINIKDSA